MLPPSLFKKLLKALDFNVKENIINSQNKVQIVVSNNKDDELIPQAAQLIHSINHFPSSIIAINENGIDKNGCSHNSSSQKFTDQLNTLVNGKIDHINHTMSK